MRLRVAAWNQSIAKWLRLTLFEPLVLLKIPKIHAQSITNLFSAFWHGVFPSYYISFFICNLMITAEKRAFVKKIPYFPSFCFYFILDSAMAIFKAFKWESIKVVLMNLKFHMIVLVILYAWTALAPSHRKVKPE